MINNNRYTRQKLVNEINRFIEEYNKVPTSCDMRFKNGYISVDYYYKEFGSWTNALKFAGIKPHLDRDYTKEILINYLQEFANTNKRIPTCKDFRNNDELPVPGTYTKYFGSWNDALKESGFDINKSWHKNSKNDYCSVCGTTETTDWYLNREDDSIVCAKCYKPRYYFRGTMNPNSSTGIGIITEHVVYVVLNDCVKCNTIDNFCANYDLKSQKYGIINVKSAVLRHQTRNRINWQFEKKPNATIPNYYICIGFNESRSEILHVWYIPGNSSIVANRGINISLHKLERASQYEVNPALYNEVYQNLDITTLPEFRNINQNDTSINASIAGDMIEI